MKIEEIEEHNKWFVSQPSPLAPSKYVTLALLRTTTDYAAFRTETDKNINSVMTQVSSRQKDLIERAVILASKQKAVERRRAEQLIRDVKEHYDCYVKDNLCLRCPVCMLNGGIGTIEKTSGEDISVRSRVLYQTAFAIEKLEDSIETLTFNAVGERTTKTGQALNERELVKPGTHFVSIVSIIAPTMNELILMMKVILATTRYGAETRGLGTMKNEIFGLALADSEITSALELLTDSNISESIGDIIDNEEIIEKLHKKFGEFAEKAGVKINFNLHELTNISQKLTQLQVSEDFIKALFETSAKMVDIIKTTDKKK